MNGEYLLIHGTFGGIVVVVVALVVVVDEGVDWLVD